MTWSPMLGPCPPHSHDFTRTPVCLSGSHRARGLLLRLAPGTGDSLLRTPIPELPVGAGLRLGAEAQCGAVCAQLAHGHKPAPHTLRPGRPGPSPGRAPGTWPATRPGLRQVGPRAGPRAGLVCPSPQGPASWGSHGWADEPREVLREPDATPAGAATPPERRKADLHLPAGSGSPAEQGNGRPPAPPPRTPVPSQTHVERTRAPTAIPAHEAAVRGEAALGPLGKKPPNAEERTQPRLGASGHTGPHREHLD